MEQWVINRQPLGQPSPKVDINLPPEGPQSRLHPVEAVQSPRSETDGWEGLRVFHEISNRAPSFVPRNIHGR